MWQSFKEGSVWRVSFYTKGQGHREAEKRVGAHGANRPLLLERWRSRRLGAVHRRHTCRKGCGYKHADTRGPGEEHTKWRQRETATRTLTHTWNLKYDTSELTCETETASPRGQTRGCGEGGGAESGVSRRKPGYAGRRNQGLLSNMLWCAVTEKNKKRKCNKKSIVLIRLQTTDSRIPTNPKQDLKRKKKVLKIRKSTEITVRRAGGT